MTSTIEASLYAFPELKGKAAGVLRSMRTRKTLEDRQDHFNRELERIANILSSETRIEDAHRAELNELMDQIGLSGYEYTDLRRRANLLSESMAAKKEIQEKQDRFNELNFRRATLESELAEENGRYRGYDIGSWISLGVGVGSLTGMGITLFKGDDSYTRYNQATRAEDAVSLREETLRYQTMTLTTAVIGGLGIATFTILQLLRPRPTRVQREMREVESQIQELEQEDK